MKISKGTSAILEPRQGPTCSATGRMGSGGELSGLMALAVAAVLLGTCGQEEPADMESSVVRRALGLTASILIEKDTFTRSGAPNRSQGFDTRLRLQASGNNRALVGLSAAQLDSVAACQPTGARLELAIVDNGNNWGSAGRPIDLHRVLRPWTEHGATHNCADDALPDNSTADCQAETAWNMNNGAGAIWKATPTATQMMSNGQAGTVIFDVTGDVVAFVEEGAPAHGWLLKKRDEGQSGQVEFGSGESAQPPLLHLDCENGQSQPDGGTPPTREVVVAAEADTELRQGEPNKNRGTEGALRLQASGSNRALVRFDLAAQGILPEDLMSAALELTIADNANNWGEGRTVGAFELTVPWTELGATWMCSVDTDTGNSQPNCPTSAWGMSGAGPRPYNLAPAGTAVIQNQQMGIVRVDVTASVRSALAAAAHHGWLLKKGDESESGRVDFGARESSQPPRLVLTVASTEADAGAGADGPVCTPTAASDESCNGVDEDCDGVADEDFVPEATMCGLGVCAGAGMTACVAGTVTDSCQPGPPTAPTDHECNALDDDCDGEVDEEFMGAETGCGVGGCARGGQEVCTGGVVMDSCQPGVPGASDATCDGIDDDCDEQADEDFRPGSTTCDADGCLRAGLATSCADGVPQDSCTAASPCIAETACFDGFDNDGDGATDCADTDCTTGPLCVNLPPGLFPIGNQSVVVGNTLALVIGASDPEGTVTFFGARPLPLPDGARLDAATGRFSFAPSMSHVGEHVITFTASDGRSQAQETVTITVVAPPPGTPTGLSGVIRDADEAVNGIVTPLVGATVRDLATGISTTTAADGTFTISGLPAGKAIIEFNGSTATGSIRYGSFRGTRFLEAGVTKVIDRPIFLPRIDVAGETIVDPNATTIVHNPDLGITLTIAPGTVVDDFGNLYSGPISLSDVPRNFTPGAGPPSLGPAVVYTVQPMGLRFTQPAPFVFPNIGEFTPGSEMEIWSLDHDTGQFFVAGTARVTPDGQFAETIAGGLQESSWHFPLPPLAESKDDGNPDNEDDDRNDQGCFSSRWGLTTGCLGVDVALPGYESQDTTRSLRFVYKSERARPFNLLPMTTTIPVRSAVPLLVSHEVNIGGLATDSRTFMDTRSVLSENVDESFVSAAGVDTTFLGTGIFVTKVRVTSWFNPPENPNAAFRAADVKSEIVVIDDSKSPLGAGWGLAGLQRLYAGTQNSILLVDGSGEHKVYRPDSATPAEGDFVSPDGDYAVFEKHMDGTFTRRMKDRMTYLFDAAGFLTSMVDTNANATTFSYDNDLLIRITDPLGRQTTLAYVDQHLSQVQDPSGRQTHFAHDDAGNLTQVTFPDGSVRKFGYDPAHLMTSETDERGFTKYRKFDSTGRAVGVILPDGSQRTMVGSATVIYLTFAGGGGGGVRPPPVKRLVDKVSIVTDAEGRVSRYSPAGFQQVGSTVDPAGLTATRGHDEDGNLTQTVAPSGQRSSMTYDSSGNLLTYKDEVLNGTTTFGYEPTFNQVTAITDSRQKTTSISYDTRGNPTLVQTPLGRTVSYTHLPDGRVQTITDALGAVSTFSYDSAGNVTQIKTVAGADERISGFTRSTTGAVATMSDALQRLTQLTRDAHDRVTVQTRPDLQVVETAYDRAGNVLGITPPGRAQHRFQIDARGRLSEYVPPAADTFDPISRFGYDREGLPTAVALPRQSLSPLRIRFGRTTVCDHPCRGELRVCVRSDQGPAHAGRRSEWHESEFRVLGGEVTVRLDGRSPRRQGNLPVRSRRQAGGIPSQQPAVVCTPGGSRRVVAWGGFSGESSGRPGRQSRGRLVR